MHEGGTSMTLFLFLLLVLCNLLVIALIVVASNMHPDLIGAAFFENFPLMCVIIISMFVVIIVCEIKWHKKIKEQEMKTAKEVNRIRYGDDDNYDY